MKSLKRKSSIIIISSGIAISLFLIWLVGTIPSSDVFDSIISADLIEYSCTNIVPYTITNYRSDFKLEYRINFKLETTQPDLYSFINITIQPSWFITPLDSVFISPNGGGDSTSITTSDGKFDVIVEQSNRGMEGVTSPSILTKKIAQKLDQLYSETAN